MKRLICMSAVLGLACTGASLAQSPTHVGAIVNDKTPVVHREIQMPQGDLYNTMGYIYGTSYGAGNGDNIGGIDIFGVDYNLGAADDVKLDANYLITVVECGYVNFFGASNTDALVEVFEDAGGVPAEAPVCSACLPGVSTGFSDPIFGLAGNILTVDTTSAACCVGPGVWWFASQPISRDWNYVCRSTREVLGYDSCGRDSGGDHRDQGACAGGGLGGGYGLTNWTPFASIGYGAGTVAMRVGGDACGGLDLTIRGNCPGTMEACISGSASGNMCYIVYSFKAGSKSVPGCPGLALDLSAPKVAGQGKADANGNFCAKGSVPAAACGRVLVQGLDHTACAKTPVRGV